MDSIPLASGPHIFHMLSLILHDVKNLLDPVKAVHAINKRRKSVDNFGKITMLGEVSK
jgi:hypothetical protein